MTDGERVSCSSQPHDQIAELRLRAVVALYERRFRMPVEGTIPDSVRLDMEPGIQGDARGLIDKALEVTTDWNGDDAGPIPSLHAGAQDWLAAVSTVPHGHGATNLDRLREAMAAADRGYFAQGEFDDLWRHLRDCLRQD